MNSQVNTKRNRQSTLSRYARLLGFETLHTRLDINSNMHAIISIHNTTQGPAIGGCRFQEYDSTGAAIYDSLRLAYMMTIKSAVCGLPHGGAKSVIIAPKTSYSRQKMFEAFGNFVNDLKGQYITACDVGTSTEDMDIIASKTPYVIGAEKTFEHNSSPSPYTARGVFTGIKAAVAFKLKKNDLSGVHVAIQGVGHVGYELCKSLTAAGAKITVCDANEKEAQRAVNDFGVARVNCDEIYDLDCDVFSPCALGNSININSIVKLKAKIIAGAANNQLSHQQLIHQIQSRNILYAPDFVINAGGLIHAAMVHDFSAPEKANKKIDELYNTLIRIFETTEQNQSNPLEEAFSIAREKMQKKANPETKGQPQDDRNKNRFL